MFPPGGGHLNQHLAGPQARHSSTHSRDYHISHQEDLSSPPEQDNPTGRFTKSFNSSARSLSHELHSPPVRDVSSIKGVKYGNGHEKYPSWPTSAAAEVPAATRSPPTGGSHRSKSWTDHTQYPKENLVLYTRPFMKRDRQHQLKPVFEGADRTMPGPYKSHRQERSEIYEEEKKYEEKESYAEKDFGIQSLPEREVRVLQNVEEYSTVYEVKKMVIHQDVKTQYLKYASKEHKKLTQAELEEYTKNYEESLQVQHQKQSSYAQSEGYHSYVSSTDSTSTPFLDRLRREADSSVSRSDSGLSGGAGAASWEPGSGDRDSVVTSSSSSGSSSETLKWHGSLSDVSVASSSLSLTSRQLIAHSAKVKTPQRHGSESVLYIARPAESDIEHRTVPPGNCQKHLKLFPVSTYAVPETSKQNTYIRGSTSCTPPQMSVAERVSELERQNKFAAYQDGKRQIKVGDPNLKAKQKSALLSFYERQQQKDNKQSWRSEPQLTPSTQPPPPVQQPRPQPLSRRASCASDYTDWRTNSHKSQQQTKTDQTSTPEQQKYSHSLSVPNSSRFSPNSVLDGPVIVGPVISLDDWVPERPPKNAKFLRNLFPDLYIEDERLPSPDLPLPSPPPVIDDEVCNDEPFPPPPTEITEWKYEQEIPQRLVSDKPNKLIKSPVMENVARPMPIRPVIPPESEQSIPQSEHARHPSRPTELLVNTPNTSPYSCTATKRPYSNLKEKPHRNSFRSPNENAPESALPQNIRASMRNYRSNLLMQNKNNTPQKPIIAAQKLLLRSTTVDESTPKRSMNMFSRSTSLRQNELSRRSVPLGSPQQAYSSDRIQNTRNSCGNSTFNGNPAVLQKENEAKYRSKCDKSKSVVSTIEQLQSKLKGIEINMESTGASSSSVTGHHHVNSSKISQPPPLFPKQSLPTTHIKPIAPEEVSTKRSNDSVCYAPSRAKLPDPSTGSYKLILPKEDQPSCPKPIAMPDLILHNDSTKPSYPTFEYITRKTCEKLLSIPIEYSKKYPVEVSLKQPQKANIKYDARLECTEENDSTLENKQNVEVSDPEPILAVAKRTETTKYEEIQEKVENQDCDGAVQAHPVIVEEQESSDESEEEVETVVELPEVTRWWETVSALEQFVHAREKLLLALPEDHEMRKLISLTQDQRNPIDFIKDFFGIVPSSGADAQRAEDGDGGTEIEKTRETDGTTGSTEQLVTEVINCSERLVTALEAASALVSEAISSNDQLGVSVLKQLPDPLSAKFTSHHTEVFHISSLMAALSARLARTYDEQARNFENEQLKELLAKREKLQDQLEEARSLKKNIDTRASLLAAKISHALDSTAYHNYRLFMAVKPRLIIRAKHLQYRIEYERERYTSLQQLLNDRLVV